MPARLRLNHMSILVQNLERSATFYQQVLRLPEIECLARKPNIRWFAVGEEHSIHLIEGDFGATFVKINTHLCISTSDFEETLAHLAATGTPYRNIAGEQGKPHIRADGVKSVYLQDPDGYWIELNEDY